MHCSGASPVDVGIVAGNDASVQARNASMKVQTTYAADHACPCMADLDSWLLQAKRAFSQQKVKPK